MSQHLGDETIAAMLEGALADDTAQRARAHIAGCDACRQMVSAAIEAAGPAGSGAPVTESSGAPSPSPIGPGSVIADKYRIDRPLGQGGVGRVFVAHQLGLDRAVAIKILLPELARDAGALGRFQREARIVAALASDHVVRVHDLGELATGEPYLVMELLEGEDLAHVVARGPVPVAQATQWIRAACEAIGEAHSRGILHRDLKPSNLFVTLRGQLKVLDFGLAKLVTTPLTSTSMTSVGMVLGSPRYMAPEQITNARDVDARADVWALGATLYHLVTGRPPFAQESVDAIFGSILAGQMPPFGEIAAPIARVIERAMARDPNARFSSATELGAALAAAQGPGSGLAPAVTSKRRRWVIASSAAAVGAAIVLAIAIPHMSRPAAEPPQTSRPAAEPPQTSQPAAAPPDQPGVAPSPEPHPGSGDSWSAPAVATPANAPAPAAPPASTAAKVPPPVAATGGNGRLGNMTPDRLRKRLESRGWVIKETNHESFSCDHTRLLAEWPANAQRWADVTLLVCGDRMTAASEGARLRRGFSGSWVVDDDTLVLAVSTNSTVGSDEKQAKALFDQLVAP